MAPHEDPFLEFEPEPAEAGRGRLPAGSLIQSVVAPPPAPVTYQSPDLVRPPLRFPEPEADLPAAPDEPIGPRPARTLSPALGFALGVAGIAASATAFYQMNGLLARRAQESSSVAAAAAALPPPAPLATSEPEATPLEADADTTGEAAPAVTPGEGSVAFDAGISLQVLLQGKAIGTTSGPLRLPVGIHNLVLASETYNVRIPIRVAITEDRVTRTAVLLPMGSLSINALPWAEVWVDGRSVGLTPMANLAVPVGRREIVWRHPQLGERRQTIVVRARVPVQVGVDLTR
jgi:hypothetical protein